MSHSSSLGGCLLLRMHRDSGTCLWAYISGYSSWSVFLDRLAEPFSSVTGVLHTPGTSPTGPLDLTKVTNTEPPRSSYPRKNQRLQTIEPETTRYFCREERPGTSWGSKRWRVSRSIWLDVSVIPLCVGPRSFLFTSEVTLSGSTFLTLLWGWLHFDYLLYLLLTLPVESFTSYSCFHCKPWIFEY